jgi:hypothetical protein
MLLSLSIRDSAHFINIAQSSEPRHASHLPASTITNPLEPKQELLVRNSRESRIADIFTQHSSVSLPPIQLCMRVSSLYRRPNPGDLQKILTAIDSRSGAHGQEAAGGPGEDKGRGVFDNQSKAIAVAKAYWVLMRATVSGAPLTHNEARVSARGKPQADRQFQELVWILIALLFLLYLATSYVFWAKT